MTENARAALCPDRTASDGTDRLFALLIGVYLSGGLLNSLISLLVPRETVLLGLATTQAMTIQFAYYSSYLLFALPITLAVVRIGYMRSIATGLSVMALGCLAFVVAQARLSYGLTLASLLVVSSGVTFLQIAGNAVTRAFGGSAKMATRLTMLQGFNSLGTVAGPLIGAHFLLGARGRWEAGAPFGPIAAVLLLLAVLFAWNRRLLPVLPQAGPTWTRLGRLLGQRRMLGGIAVIFAYVGAEVTVGTLAVAYLMLPTTIAATGTGAGRLVSVYWGAAMVGRFGGAYLLRRSGAGRLLTRAAIGAVALLGLAIAVQGAIGAMALLMVGLCNSVMFPLSYALAQPEAEADGPLAGMLLCMAVVGGAIIPLFAGMVADHAGLASSLFVPIVCYLVVLLFGAVRGRTAEGVA
jgi:FHS family L-fucose permease-like MFS transporter